MKTLEITVGGTVVHADLLEDVAPVTCANVERWPTEGMLNHAKVCDNEVFVQAPFFQDQTENVKIPEIGELGYWVAHQTICAWFAETQPLGPITVFARIHAEDIPTFARIATKVWSNDEAIPIRLVVKNDISVSVARAVEAIQSECAKVWVDRPRDIGLLRRREGAKKRHLNITLYAETDTEGCTEGLHVLRACTLDENTDVRTLAMVARNYLEFYRGRFIRYFHLEELPAVMTQALQALDDVSTREELRLLIEAVESYVGKLWGWVDLEIPYEFLKTTFGQTSKK